MPTKFISAVFVLTLGAGCSFFSSQSSNYCESAPNNNCMDLIDAAIDGPPTGCKAEPSKCTGSTAVCDTVADVCVECLPGSAAACVGVEPVCGVNNSCRGCTAHSECASAVCLPDGSCASGDDVAYVDGTTGAGTTCTQVAPCKTVTLAVATPKAMIKVTGTVRETTIAFAGTTAKTLIGAPGAKIEGTTGSQNLIELRDTGALTVRDLIVGGTAGNKPTACFALIAGTPSLTVTKSKIENCQVGITSSGGTVTVTGATVSGNTNGGIDLSTSSFSLVNNFIVKNGGPGSPFGGVRLRDYLAVPALHEMSFNTIANNQANAGFDSGLTCSTVSAALVTSSNIMFNNTSTTTTITTNCSYTHTASSSTLIPGMGNVMAAPTFVDVVNGNFHLKDAATNVGIANPLTASNPAATLATDVDGELRPQGGNRDLGADEVP